MYVQQFLDRVRAKFATGQATEHSYRSALEQLFDSIPGGNLKAINEPKKVACGAPDLILMRGEIPVGHCEAKDLHIDLGALKDANLDQKKRYLKALPNLVYTNGLDFEFYRAGEKIREISIGVLDDEVIEALPHNFEALNQQLRAFAAERPQTIGSARKLAEMMAGKAALIKDIMGRTLKADADFSSELGAQYRGFQKHLIHDISPDEFADIYAETIAYGMFAARLHDTSLATFSREEALKLLPKSNPFLRNLFAYIAGPTLDERIAWVVDDLADIFQAADVHALMEDFGKLSARNDPFLHFYETFLAAYNPAKRKARGVWYTPEPVVNFIVRAVDDVLKTEFGLKDGLADTSKITIDWDTGQTDGKGKSAIIKKQVHRVQVLDPATGTGTFLAEVVKQIAPKVKKAAEGMWSNYVEQDLIPRLHGFELLMASYAMCHLKLDMVLTELGYKPSAAPPRLGIYLTNSLEEGEKVSQDLFAQWLANEAREASNIKRQMPIMCVIGNPPYSGISQNMGAWIVDKIEDYKYVDGSHFGETKHWLHDDYVKFIRLAEYMIENNGEGILGFITNHGYLDNPTFRGMRHHLLETFDKIYVLDLHGNAKKKEVSPDGSPDKNVFDIQQGVAILVGIKKAPSLQSRARGKVSGIPAADVYHADLWGSRESKYEKLWTAVLRSPCWNEISPSSPQFLLVPQDSRTAEQYNRGFALDAFFRVNVSGVVTARDHLVTAFSEAALVERISRFRDPRKSDSEVRSAFFPGKKAGKYLPGDTRGWKLADVRPAILADPIGQFVHPITYRPLDTRFIYYRPDMVDWGREPIVGHFLRGPNVGLVFVRGSGTYVDLSVGVTRSMIDQCAAANKSAGGGISYQAPLYLYAEEGSFDLERRVNFDPAVYDRLREVGGLMKGPLREIHDRRDGGKPDELRVFDYIYGMLHSPDYRRTYAEFLKTDFPRIPYPSNPKEFADVAEKGGQLRRLHLMEDDAVGETPYPFRGEGTGELLKPAFTEHENGIGDIFINPHQHFANVPRIAWEFHIGGYQPAQKWLKDRKGLRLTFDEVRHYQKIIKVLSETDRIMKAIELPL